MSEHEKHIDEQIAVQVQSAIAPLVTIINSLRKEVATLTMEVQAINNIVIGARFLGTTGKVILSIGAIVTMFWGLFTILSHKA